MATTPTETTPCLSCSTPAASYSRRLLIDLGINNPAETGVPVVHPARRQADTGLMILTGERGATPELCAVPLASCADGALFAYRALTRQKILPGVDGGQLLTDRAAITGYRRSGSTSPQGHCRLLSSKDGQIGLNLAREDDWSLLPALLGKEGPFDWESLAGEINARTTAELLVQGKTLGLAIVDATAISRDITPWFTVAHTCATKLPQASSRPRVVDLSSLWAGPLCSHLWQMAGADVIKVESSQRPDGGRKGSADFFELLNRGKQCVSLDLHCKQGRQALKQLIDDADIVLEASRPRALRQMGFIAEDILDEFPGKTWVSITGYGRTEPGSNWIAYGDDAGISAGLSAILHKTTGKWLICGDAIADPLTGLHAALAGWFSWQQGGGRLIDISLEQVVQHCIAATAPEDHDYVKRYARWCAHLVDKDITATPPRRR